MSTIQGIFGDQKARVIRLKRSQKKRYAVVVAQYIEAITTRQYGRYGICPVEMPAFIWKWRFGVYNAGSAGK